jgi:hypothetical protein
MARKILSVFFPASMAFLLWGCGPGHGYVSNEIPEIQDQAGIMGGEPVTLQDPASRYTVALYDEKSSSTCSGSLIAQDTVLTAAHCVNPHSPHLSILFSNHLRESGRLNRSFMRSAVRFLQHPRYKSRHDKSVDTFDLALVHFAGGLPAGYEVTPLAKSVEPDLNSQNSFLAAGFGFTNGLFRTGLGTLRQVSLKYRQRHSQTEFETEQNSVGVCSGDSGGPLFLEKSGHLVQIAVASRVATKFLGCRKYAVYTRVDVHQEWILQTTQALRLPKAP